MCGTRARADTCVCVIRCTLSYSLSPSTLFMLVLHSRGHKCRNMRANFPLVYNTQDDVKISAEVANMHSHARTRNLGPVNICINNAMDQANNT